MKYCDRCKVNLPNEEQNCPLCQSNLITKKEHNDILFEAFPTIPTVYSQFNVFLRIMLFISIFTVVTSALINVLIPQNVLWCLFVLVGNIYIWLSVFSAINKRGNVSKAIIYQTIFSTIFCVVFDNWIGYTAWSVNYAIPVIYITSTGAIFAVSVITRKKAEEYSMYLLINNLIILVPVILLITKVTTIVWPSLIAIATSILVLSAVFIFTKTDWLSEFKRRFHL